MTRARRYRDDKGQAFPIYITVVAGLLFLAFAYFAVGQATVSRSSAQTAADAAALAAAQDTRDRLAAEWVKAVLDPDAWEKIFHGDAQGIDFSCSRAQELAQRNHAHVLDCTSRGPLAYAVDVETDETMGKSVVPITENKRSKGHAMAVIEPLCDFVPLAADSPPDTLPRLTCENNRYWDLDPKDLTDLPEPRDLFDVHLADRQPNE